MIVLLKIQILKFQIPNLLILTHCAKITNKQKSSLKVIYRTIITDYWVQTIIKPTVK